jgi:hypothetical protein
MRNGNGKCHTAHVSNAENLHATNAHDLNALVVEQQYITNNPRKLSIYVSDLRSESCFLTSRKKKGPTIQEQWIEFILNTKAFGAVAEKVADMVLKIIGHHPHCSGTCGQMVTEIWIVGWEPGVSANKQLSDIRNRCRFGKGTRKHDCVRPDTPFIFVVSPDIPPERHRSIKEQAIRTFTTEEFAELSLNHQ